jgi:hypothetical protein
LKTGNSAGQGAAGLASAGMGIAMGMNAVKPTEPSQPQAPVQPKAPEETK